MLLQNYPFCHTIYCSISLIGLYHVWCVMSPHRSQKRNLKADDLIERNSFQNQLRFVLTIRRELPAKDGSRSLGLSVLWSDFTLLQNWPQSIKRKKVMGEFVLNTLDLGYWLGQCYRRGRWVVDYPNTNHRRLKTGSLFLLS